MPHRLLIQRCKVNPIIQRPFYQEIISITIIILFKQLKQHHHLIITDDSTIHIVSQDT